jgi:hydroxymethylpyrimidine/phosphomethylpyrimidine kinase
MTFILLRASYFNGNMIESERLYGVFHTEDEAHNKASELEDMVLKNVALKGFSFTFFIRRFVNDGLV